MLSNSSSNNQYPLMNKKNQTNENDFSLSKFIQFAFSPKQLFPPMVQRLSSYQKFHQNLLFILL